MLDDNDIKMYSIYNIGKYVVAERFVRTLKNKIYEHMAAVSKSVYFDKEAATLATKAELKAKQDKIIKLEAFYFCG